MFFIPSKQRWQRKDIESRKRCRRISTTVELEIAVMFILVVIYFCMQYLFIMKLRVWQKES